MFDTLIPRTLYDIATYPNLEANAKGRPIPNIYGDIHNLIPTCIDTATGKWKLACHPIKAIDAIRDGAETLVSGIDYTPDLVNAEFIIQMTPFLAANTTHYFVIEFSGAIDGVNYIGFAHGEDFYASGQRYEIDGGGAWAPIATKDMYFEIYGKKTMDSDEELMVPGNTWSYPTWNLWNRQAYLKKTAANTRIAQSFLTGSDSFYITRIRLEFCKYGNPSGYLTLSILSAYTPTEVQVGADSRPWVISEAWEINPWWAQRAETSELLCDVQGRMNADASLVTNVADILTDVLTSASPIGLGVSVSALDAAAFTALKAARTEALAIPLITQISFRDFVAKLEAGQIFKFLHDLSGLYTVKYYTSGEPSGTPHIPKQAIKSISMSRRWSDIISCVQVKYAQDPASQEWLVYELASDIAKYVYRKENTLILETFLSAIADAQQLAEDYFGTDVGSSRKLHLQYPGRYLDIDVTAAYGVNQIPTEKISVNFDRADYPSGALAGVLFRILSLEKRPNGTSKITAILDTMTY